MVSEKSIDIDAPAARIWEHLADFSNWKALTLRRGLITRFTMDYSVAEGSVPGPGMRLVMQAQKTTQIWVAEEWEPQKRMRLSFKSASRLAGYTTEIAFTIAPKTSLTTQVDLTFTFEPARGSLLILLTAFGFQRNMDAFMGEILGRLRAALGG